MRATKIGVSPQVTRRRFIAATALGVSAVRTAPRALAKLGESTAAKRIAPSPKKVFGSISPSAFAQAQHRAWQLVEKLSPAEIINQLGNSAPAIKRVGLPAYQYWHEALHGLLHSGPVTSFPVPLAMANTWDPSLQLRAYTAVSDEARAYHNLRGTDLTFYSPQTLNTARDPRWGRIDETLGEDPHLVGMMAAAAVRGMQGDDPRHLKTVCCAKHFICNETEDDRHTTSATVDPRSFWEYFTAPFEAAVRSGVGTVMSSYNEINGNPCTGDRTLLTDILRERWGFAGYVTSDCDAVGDIYRTHHYVPSAAQAAAMALQAGCDLNCGDTYQKYLGEALSRQLVALSDLKLALTRLLTIRMLLGEFDRPDRVAYSAIRFDTVDSPAHRKLALEAARDSIVLLKNEANFLPLAADRLKSVAIIGPLAARCALGGYAGGPFVHVSPLEGIAAALGVKAPHHRIPAVAFTAIDWRYKFDKNVSAGSKLIGTQNTYWVELPAADFTGIAEIKARASAAGTGGVLEVHADSPAGPIAAAIKIGHTGGWNRWATFGEKLGNVAGRHALYLVFRGDAASHDLFHLDWIELVAAAKPATVAMPRVKVSTALGCTVAGPANPRWLRQAAALARRSDAAFVVVGADQTVDHEELDRADIVLPGAQHELIKAVAEANPNTVVIITSNCPVAIPTEQANSRVKGILCALAAGQAGGTAIADALFGAINPGGKLATTWFTGLKQLPDFHDYNIRNERTYMYFTGKPLYPFGFGLSYTTFKLSNMAISHRVLKPGGRIEVSMDVRNTGSRAGDEVVQLYVTAPACGHKRPQRQLAAFLRVRDVKPGESRRVALNLPYAHPALRIWDESRQRFIIPTGKLLLAVGNSSANLPLSAAAKITT